MSLILRKKCEPVLEASMLADYHTRIDTNNNITIVGPCGRSLFSISGIKFSRNVPNAAEIDYAVELLEQFCEVHKLDILNVIKTKEKLFKAIVPITPGEFTVNLHNKYIVYHYGNNIQLHFYPATSIIEFGTSGCSEYQNITLEEIKLFTKVSLYKRMREVYNEVKAYDLIESTYSDAVSKLQTCEI